MKRKNAPGKTARHGLAAAPYTKKGKRPYRYSFTDSFKPLPLELYMSMARDPIGHPYRARDIIKRG